MLVEEFIDGDELTVGLVGNQPPDVLGIMRVVPRVAGRSVRLQPGSEARLTSGEFATNARPALPAATIAAVRQCRAGTAGSALGCRDVARIDFRLRDGVPYFLEANPLPGLSPISGDLVMLAGYVGIEYPDLIGRILQAACERLNLVCESSWSR